MPEIKNALKPGTLLTSGQQTYRVVKVLGAGGFGITYLVEAQIVEGDSVMSFFYAMKEHFLSRCCERATGTSKVLYSNPVADEVQNSQRDFMAEAVRLQKLGSRHDNIVKVREIFEANNTAYYIMEYLQGDSLRQYVDKRGALSEQEMLALTTPILDAVGFLHANRMTHLDIKPENIMLTPDPTGKSRPVLIDFGLSKHYDGDGHPTSTIKTLGCSDGYSPVEQYGGITTFSPTADIYALGATMAFCATGRVPKKATDMLPGDAAAYTAGLSPAVGNTINKMLEMNRSARPQSVAEVFAMLNAPAPPVPPVGPATPPPTPPGPGIRPRPRPVKKDNTAKKTVLTILGVVGGLAVLGGIIALLMNVFGSDDDMPVEYGIGDVVSEYYNPEVSETNDSHAGQELSEIAGNSPMAIGLLWDSSKDLDLIVNQPNLNYIYYGETSDTSTGGTFGGDARGGNSSTEYITWSSPESGRYDVFVRGRDLSTSGTPVKVVIKDGSDYTTYSATLKRHGDTADYKISFYFRSDNSIESEEQDNLPTPELTTVDNLPVTYVSGSTSTYSSGNVVSSYVEANTSTSYDSGAVSRANSVGSNGPVKVTLLWDASNDLDLIVNQANMTDIYYGNSSDSSYGASYSGDNTGGQNSYESISWSRPGSGIYDVFVRVRGSIPSSGVPVKVVVKNGSSVTTYATNICQRGSTNNDVRLAQFSYSGDSGSGSSGTGSTPSSLPVTNANGSETSYSSGNVVSSYVEANTSTSYDSGAVSRANSVGFNGPVKVTLLWDASNDLDLIVNQANMTDIYYSNRIDSSYGASHSGDNTGGRNSYESISWARPGSGIYDVFVRVRGSIPSSGVPVKVVVKNGSNTTTYATCIRKSGSDNKDVRIVQFRYSGDSGSGNSGTGNTPSSLPVTNANGSETSYSSGNVVSTYVEANTSTSYDSGAVSRANSVGSNGPIKVTMLWDASSDLDLIVNQADMTDIYYNNRSDSSYGASHSGDNTGGRNSYESISWSRPGNGIYDVFVRVRGSIPSSGVPVKVVVKNGSNTTTYATCIRKSGSNNKDVRIVQFRY